MTSNDDRPGVTGGVPVKSAARVLDLLEDIAAHGPATRAELSLRMGIPKSSMHAVLRTMTERGWLELDHARGAYRLGFGSMAVSAAHVEDDPVIARAAPILDRLAAATGETVHLGRLHGSHVVFLDKRESARPVPMASAVGRRMPAWSTSLGRAVLATRPVAVREALVPGAITRMTQHTRTDRAAVLAAIEQASVRGYAVESQEVCPGIRCFAVAVGALVPAGAPVHAVSVAVPLARLDRSREARVVRSLLELGPRAAGRAPSV
ncbi:IclR family transcriptional regulator [Nocardioides sp. zg-1228]|uniref:IclR family transcriptional regulator n=1 Tax=Nocardioides sp. zg-1228 TaxID=2763008 RepID=UPI0016428C53|nr:IclR family transcriptional regulator [Nocardioides sp. zg-1228]MBC2932515.1 IclR family transcriptional regulator [Nocardioides sp. zg-1228]QSF58016.1 IclR family transcriptional regulator [Nocardioides sp. zg-1228]